MKIKACIYCPYHSIDNSELPKDCDLFGIKCVHENQENIEVYHAKIKNKYYSIYFECPLTNKATSI